MTYSRTRAVAEAVFKQTQRPPPLKEADLSESQRQRHAVEAKTARLKELRLAKEAADPETGPKGISPPD
jgi:hypothetical protein